MSDPWPNCGGEKEILCQSFLGRLHQVQMHCKSICLKLIVLCFKMNINM